MANIGISEIKLESNTGSLRAGGQSTAQLNHILKFADNDKAGLGEKEPTPAQMTTELFIYEIMNKLNIDKSAKRNVRVFLHDLIKSAQILNGIQKNNLKPQGTPEQNENFKNFLTQEKEQLKDCVDFIGAGLSVVQDSKTGLYKLSINNQLYEIPERKVEIVPVESDEDVLKPKIVD